MLLPCDKMSNHSFNNVQKLELLYDHTRGQKRCSTQWLLYFFFQWGLIGSGKTNGFCVSSRALWLSFIFTFPRLSKGVTWCPYGCDQLDKAIGRSWPCVCCCHESLFCVSWSIQWGQSVRLHDTQEKPNYCVSPTVIGSLRCMYTT